jgi:hypothetical protein
MSVKITKTASQRRKGLLVLSLVLVVFTAACGSVSEDSSAGPQRETVTERGGPQVVKVHYSRPLPRDPDDGYGVEMDVIARGADQSRTKMVWLVEDGRVEMTVLIIRDGNRALAHDAEAETAYTLIEAVDEHPDDFPLESSPLDPDSDLFREACPDASRAGTRTILGREAIGYACTWDDADPALDRTDKIWLDKATGMLLESGDLKATEFVVDPEIDEDTFSTKPPAGADVDVVKATGKGPPPPGGSSR